MDVDAVRNFVNAKIGTNRPDGELTVLRRIAKPFDLGLHFSHLGRNRRTPSFGFDSQASLFGSINLGLSTIQSLLFQLSFRLTSFQSLLF